jgi:hypothetical protein
LKTVYILGAGFSKDAGAPLQSKIIEEIFKLQDELDRGHLNRFREFLTCQLCTDPDQHNHVNLEDVFTPLDKCLVENISFRGLTVQEMSDVRDSVFYLISKTLDIILADHSVNKGYIDAFADHLVLQSKKRMDNNFRANDPISVISTNWDILLDNSIYFSIKNGSFSDKGVVDYCCYISSYDKNDRTIRPGLEALGEGGFNVKLIKLHGSLNWLQCQRCMRLYVGFGQKIAIRSYDQNVSCRHCDENFNRQEKHNLKSNLIMPTYIKNLGNPQYKIIWQNAGIEISEADKLVFIGYSLPAADFEMRQLLSRMVREDAEIEVVTQCRDECVPDIELSWKRFFGRRSLNIYSHGAANYINSLED